MRSNRFSITVLAFFLLSIIVLTINTARAAAPSGGKLEFTVLREGDPIGSHVLSFEKSADTLVVTIQTKVKVKVLFLTAYYFDHEGREVWRNGQLVELVSSTDDDGTKHTVAVKGDGQASKASAKTITASLWHEGILAGGSILNTLHGKQMNITVRDAGSEDVTVGGQTVSAHHYIIEGDLERELWFDGNQVLVMVRFKGIDVASPAIFFRLPNSSGGASPYYSLAIALPDYPGHVLYVAQGQIRRDVYCDTIITGFGEHIGWILPIVSPLTLLDPLGREIPVPKRGEPGSLTARFPSEPARCRVHPRLFQRRSADRPAQLDRKTGGAVDGAVVS